MGNDGESKVLNIELTQGKIDFISNITYSQPINYFGKDIKLEMDILKPNKKGIYPAVLFVTGGSFAQSPKERYLQQRMKIAESGYVVASIQYRTVPEGVFPQSLEDVKSAIRFLKANSERYSIDKERIAIMGDSAGGYLVAMAGVTNGMKKFDKGENLSENSDIKAVVDIYGVTDFEEIDTELPENVTEEYRTLILTVKYWLSEAEKDIRSTNPISYISDKTPPFLLMHGDIDTLVPPIHTEKLHKALIEKGVESTRYLVTGAAHACEYWYQPEIVNIIINFLNEKLKNKNFEEGDEIA